MNPITAAVLKAGLITPTQLQEMKRFSPAIDPDAEAGEPADLETAASLVEQAFQSEEYVLIRETDLEAVRQYVETASLGMLHLEMGDEVADLEVKYGKTAGGEFIVAWSGESIAAAMTNGQTYLQVPPSSHVFFKDVRELFFGEQKAFMVCKPSVVEPA